MAIKHPHPTTNTVDFHHPDRPTSKPTSSSAFRYDAQYHTLSGTIGQITLHRGLAKILAYGWVRLMEG
jgi:nicotinamidase-related amidase